jgi:ribosomal protein L29
VTVHDVVGRLEAERDALRRRVLELEDELAELRAQRAAG